MNRFKLVYLKTELFVRHLGWFNILSMLLLIAISSFWTIFIPNVSTKNLNLQTQLNILRDTYHGISTKVSLKTQPENPLDLFYQSLGHKEDAIHELKVLFQIAEKNGIQLQQGNYKSAKSKETDIETYQFQLPVRATYPEIRRFCEEILLAIPFSSMDELHLKREVIGSDVVEAKLSFTLYLRPAINTPARKP